MKDSKIYILIIETLGELGIIFKKLGLPFVILGISLLVFSWKGNSPVIPFSYFIGMFLFLALLQAMFENLWLSKEINKLQKRIEDIEKLHKAK